MNILIPIALIVGGLALIFYVRTKAQSTATENEVYENKIYCRIKRNVQPNGIKWIRKWI